MACTNPPCCFFCALKEPDNKLRKEGVANCFNEMPFRDEEEHVLVLSNLWRFAMTQPNDPEFPSLGIFDCMSSFIQRGVVDRDWLLRDQNIYVPYYAAHIIGSYTMNKVEFAEKAVASGVIPPLLELLRGKITWVEQRVAVRALSHLASYEKTFEAVAASEDEVVKSTMSLASSCVDVVYNSFVVVKDGKSRLKYHRDLLTRGVGGFEMENQKAEEWASQLQCWSLYLLNCFACKERALKLICNPVFLKNLCSMWGGLLNYSSPAGVGLVRILCHSRSGRKSIAEVREVIESLCNLSRSSDDWQYVGIDCLLLLLSEQDTRYKVIEIAAACLIDLVELKSLTERPNIGEAITKALLSDWNQIQTCSRNKNFQKALQGLWELKVQRPKQEKSMSREKLEERRLLVKLIKQQADNMFFLGDTEEAVKKFTDGLELCPLRFERERIVLYSNRAQCYLPLRDPDAAISDSTRALCLSNSGNPHRKSLWTRSKAYDMKGLARESLMDCIMLVNSSIKKSEGNKSNRFSIPYCAISMISKQMEATWLFAFAPSKTSSTCCGEKKLQGPDGRSSADAMVMRRKMEIRRKTTASPSFGKEASRRKVERTPGNSGSVSVALTN